MAICITTEAQCAKKCQHINFGNDSSFLMAGDISGEERLIILSEKPILETRNWSSEDGPIVLEASLLMEEIDFQGCCLCVA